MKVTITSNGTVQGTHLEVNGVAHEDDDYVVSIEPNGDYPDVTVRFIAGELGPLNTVGLRATKGKDTSVTVEYPAWGEEQTT